MKNIISKFIILIIASSMLLFSCAKTKETKNSSITSHSSSSEVSSSSNQSSSSSKASDFPEPEKDPQYVKAYKEYAARHYESAINDCDIALKKDYKTFWAYNLKGISTYFLNGNKVASSCIDTINKSLEINPDYSYAYFNRALIEKGTKQWDKSIADFEKVLSYNKNDTWSYYGIATVYADTDDADNAIKYLKLAKELDEKGVKAQMYDDMQRHYSKLKNDSRFQELLK